MRCSRTEAPSLRRRYPVSPVLRASPPPCTARPDPRGLSVGACHATARASRVASIPLFHACRRHYPGGIGRCLRRSLPDPCQPSSSIGRVGFRINRFEACSAFARATARMVAGPPKAALRHQSASADVVTSIVRSDCYRLERQLPGGIRPAEEWHLVTAHGIMQASAISPWQKAPLHSTGDASRLTALFLGRIWPICSLVTPCQPGASPVSVRRGVSPRAAIAGLRGRPATGAVCVPVGPTRARRCQPRAPAVERGPPGGGGRRPVGLLRPDSPRGPDAVHRPTRERRAAVGLGQGVAGNGGGGSRRTRRTPPHEPGTSRAEGYPARGTDFTAGLHLAGSGAGVKVLTCTNFGTVA